MLIPIRNLLLGSRANKKQASLGLAKKRTKAVRMGVYRTKLRARKGQSGARTQITRQKTSTRRKGSGLRTRARPTRATLMTLAALARKRRRRKGGERRKGQKRVQ